MPNYDIIPLANDLLDYTIQRVKTKEPEYRKVKALVQENGQLVERDLYEKLKDDGKPHFPKSQTFHLCARLENCAADILLTGVSKGNTSPGTNATIGRSLCAPSSKRLSTGGAMMQTVRQLCGRPKPPRSLPK